MVRPRHEVMSWANQRLIISQNHFAISEASDGEHTNYSSAVASSWQSLTLVTQHLSTLPFSHKGIDVRQFSSKLASQKEISVIRGRGLLSGEANVAVQ